MSFLHGFYTGKFSPQELSSPYVWIALMPAGLPLVLLPCVTDILGYMLAIFGSQIEEAADNARHYGVRCSTIAVKEAQNPTRYLCSQLFDGAKPVYLMASNLSSSDSKKSIPSDLGLSESSKQGDIPTAELVNRFPRTKRDKSFRMHWAVEIRGTTYELVRAKNSRLVELRVTPPGSYSRVDAFGIPLSLAWVEEIGDTYLTADEIESLVRKAVGRVKYYNPLTNNCQHLWPDELLPKIICQCPDRRLLDPPSPVLSFLSRIMILVASTSLAAVVFNLLIDGGVLSFPFRFCSRSSTLGFLATELSKYYILIRQAQRNSPRLLTDTEVLIPYLDCEPLQELEAEKTGDEFHDFYFDMIIKEVAKMRYDPDRLGIYKKFSSKIVWLFRFRFLCTPLSTAISFMYRFSFSSLYQFLYIVSLVLVTFQAWMAWRLVDLPQFPALRSCSAQENKAELEQMRKRKEL